MKKRFEDSNSSAYCADSLGVVGVPCTDVSGVEVARPQLLTLCRGIDVYMGLVQGSR